LRGFNGIIVRISWEYYGYCFLIEDIMGVKTSTAHIKSYKYVGFEDINVDHNYI